MVKDFSHNSGDSGGTSPICVGKLCVMNIHKDNQWGVHGETRILRIDHETLTGRLFVTVKDTRVN